MTVPALPVTLIPQVPLAFVPVVEGAPTVLYETVNAAEPLKVDPDAPPVPETVLLNPVLTVLSSEMEEDWEGCLSVPGLRGVVSRHVHLRYQGFDQFGHVIDREVDGFHARVVQHECDHLVGMLYPMRITDFSRFGYASVLFPEMDPADDD